MSVDQSAFQLSANPTGVLTTGAARWAVVMIHGFTSGPISIRPWAQALADAGAEIFAPLLPGHGTTEADFAISTADQWRGQVATTVDHVLADDRFTHVAVAGLSMGGTLALDAAAHRKLDAVLLVNPVITFSLTDTLGAFFSPILKHIIPSVGSIADDIARPGVTEHAYARTPVAPIEQLAKLFLTVRRELDSITAPVLIHRSVQDHVVPASTVRLLSQQLINAPLAIKELIRSFHVATLDYDADQINADSISLLADIGAQQQVTNFQVRA